VQRGGRIQRILEGKGESIYLDQAGNVDRFGMFIEDVVPTELHDGEKKYRESDQIRKVEPEKEARKCTNCKNGVMLGLTCQTCGHTMPSKREQVKTVDGSLKEIKELRADKRKFLEGLLALGHERKYSNPQGWAKHRYKEKFGDWPHFPKLKPGEITAEVLNFDKHCRIKKAKSKRPSWDRTTTAKDKAIANIMNMVKK
jgi:hypothetical protein